MDMHTPFRHEFVEQLQGRKNPELQPEKDVTKVMDTIIGLAALILLVGALVADHKMFFIDLITRHLP